MSASIQTKQRIRITVPQRPANGGFDFKFESDPYNVKLYNLMTGAEYKDTIDRINEAIKPARQKTIDTALLGVGIFMVPLAIWGVRHNILTKKRKRLMTQCIQNFNAEHPTLYMRWNKQPDSSLTIERRQSEGEAPNVPSDDAVVIFDQQQERDILIPPSGRYVQPGGRPNFHAANNSHRQHAPPGYDIQGMSGLPQPDARVQSYQPPVHLLEPQTLNVPLQQVYPPLQPAHVAPNHTTVSPLPDLLS